MLGVTYEKHAPALVQLVAAAKQSLRLCLRIASTDGCTIFFLRSLLTPPSTSSLPKAAQPGRVGRFGGECTTNALRCLSTGRMDLLFDGEGSSANALRYLPTGEGELALWLDKKYPIFALYKNGIYFLFYCFIFYFLFFVYKFTY